MAADPHDEIDLWRRASGGEREAFASLVERVLPRIRRLLFRLLGFRRADVDDLTQEVFMRLIQRIRELKKPEAGPGYVRTIAVHVVREQQRRAIRQAPVANIAIEDLTEEEGSAPGSDWDLGDAELREHVAQGVAALPLSLREVLVLRVYEELAPHEIARHLKVRPEAVRNRLHRARQALKKSLHEDAELSS